MMKTISYELPDLPLKDLIKIAFLSAISLIAFILLFQPYDYNQLSSRSLFEVISFVFLSTLLVTFACLVTMKSRIGRNVWQIIIVWLFATGVLSQIIYFYTIFKGLNHFFWRGMGIYFVTSLFLSIIPLLVLFFLLKSFFAKLEHEPGQLRLSDRTLQNDKILLFRAEDNYVRIMYLNEKHELKSTLKRITMKEILKSTGNRAFIRVHRSYAINLNHFSHYSGNAKGYFVHLNHLEQIIPVSKSHGKNFLKKISSIHH